MHLSTQARCVGGVDEQVDESRKPEIKSVERTQKKHGGALAVFRSRGRAGRARHGGGAAEASRGGGAGGSDEFNVIPGPIYKQPLLSGVLRRLPPVYPSGQ